MGWKTNANMNLCKVVIAQSTSCIFTLFNQSFAHTEILEYHLDFTSHDTMSVVISHLGSIYMKHMYEDIAQLNYALGSRLILSTYVLF